MKVYFIPMHLTNVILIFLWRKGPMKAEVHWARESLNMSLLTSVYKHNKRGGERKKYIVCNGLIWGFLDSGHSKNKFQPIYQSFIEWVLISFKLKWQLWCDYAPYVSIGGQTLFFAAFWWQLPFCVVLCHQSVTHSRQHEFSSLPFQTGWSVMMWFCHSMLLKSLSECSTWSLFNILWNRKLMNEDTVTTTCTCQNTFWYIDRHLCMDFCKIVVGTVLLRAEIWTGLEKTWFCLSYPFVSDSEQEMCPILDFICSIKRKMDWLLGSFLALNVSNSIKLFCWSLARPYMMFTCSAGDLNH